MVEGVTLPLFFSADNKTSADGWDAEMFVPAGSLKAESCYPCPLLGDPRVI